MLLKFKRYSGWLWILTGLASGSAWAQAAAQQSGGAANLGTVASNLTDATDVFTGIFSAIFYVIGIAMFAAGIMRYRDYRQNPVQTPISRVIFSLLAGLVIGFFPMMINYISASIAHT